MLTYPFDHECQWVGPMRLWSDGNTADAPPAGAPAHMVCAVCGAMRYVAAGSVAPLAGEGK